MQQTHHDEKISHLNAVQREMFGRGKPMIRDGYSETTSKDRRYGQKRPSKVRTLRTHRNGR